MTNLLIVHATVVTMDRERRILRDAAVAVEGGRIAALGPSADLQARYPGAERIDASGMAALPGLIDAHAHADQSLLRGLGDGLHWMTFLDDVVTPYLTLRDPADGVLANLLSMAEMARCGTTCFVSPNVDPRDDLGGISAAAGAVGIRSVLCRFTSPRPGPDSREAARAAVDAAVRHMEPWQGAAGGLVSVWFGLDVPRRPGDTVHPEFYREVAAESRRAGVGISYHFASEVEDADYMVKTFGLRPAEWSQRHHALGPNVLLINGCWVDATDIRILVETGTHLSHSPVANTKMATGILPVGEVLAGGVNLCIGTDGGLNNNTHDMFGEMKAACLLQNIVRRSAAALTPEAALEMATIAGARAIGRERELGSLEAGKLADIVLVDLRRTHVAPVHGVVSSLVFAAGRGDVDTVIVGGRVVVRAGRVLGADEAELCRRAQERAEPLRRLLGRRGPGAWPGDRPE